MNKGCFFEQIIKNIWVMQFLVFHFCIRSGNLSGINSATFPFSMRRAHSASTTTVYLYRASVEILVILVYHKVYNIYR